MGLGMMGTGGDGFGSDGDGGMGFNSCRPLVLIKVKLSRQRHCRGTVRN